ncbi:MAG: hypothetical protein Q4A32_05820 [Lachnospiraceae bacterium]|nr:hypothetical protein [Lachnospiraceae bacterium]
MRKKAFALALATALTLGSAVPVLATYDNGIQATDDEGFDDEGGYDSPEMTVTPSPTIGPGGGDESNPDGDTSITPIPTGYGSITPVPTEDTSVTPRTTITPSTRTTITPRATTPPTTTSPKTGQVDYLLFGTLGAAACASVVVVSKKKNEKK